jgi:acyl-CoA reductase-like NAD-dependent aldehyde dehydrogenase
MRQDLQEKIFINNQWIRTETTRKVLNPFDDSWVGVSGFGDEIHMNEAINAAEKSFEIFKQYPTHLLADGLNKMKLFLEVHLDEIAETLSQEAGKPMALAQGEVVRAIHTFEDGVEECKRQYGETMPLDRRPWGDGKTGIIQRFPLGVIAAITPFNFPLNLAAHKIVPALASRNTVVLRPASQTPFTAMYLAKAYEESGLPAGGLNVVPCNYNAADVLVEDERVKKITFTGSPKVGWKIKERAPMKKVSLELGGNAAIIVHRDADLEKASIAIRNGAFFYAGQSCISAQRVYVHRSVFDAFSLIFKTSVEALKVGDPRLPETQVGPLINMDEANRVMDWIHQAIEEDATCLTGGEQNGSVITPTVLLDSKSNMAVNCMEVFGPVLTLTPYDDFQEAIDEVNNSDFGLQAGVFTNDVRLIQKAYSTLNVGGVIINDVSTWRIDHMPYGGVKQSGVGREGVRFAMNEMTEPKLLVISS